MDIDTIVLVKHTGQRYTVSVEQCVPPGQDAMELLPWQVHMFDTAEEAGTSAEELRRRLGIEAQVVWCYP
jgi:hypothetical protein